jgi:alkylation response protein AidB-like acyl-CoA dehydrogenase
MSPDLASALTPVVGLFAQEAADVDRAAAVPLAHLDALAAIGLYGAFAPVASGGLGLDREELAGVVEVLASACLASTFLWIQHFRLLEAALDDAAVDIVRRARFDIVSGALKGGISLTGMQPGPARLVATPSSAGWTLRGESPWVSGWGIVDVLYVAARSPEDTVVHLLLDPRDQPGLEVVPYDLSALNATRTVRLRFDDLELASERWIATTPYTGGTGPPEALRVNGSLALGVARRCCSLLGASPLDGELVRCREALAGADATTIASARAGACELAVRAAHALSVRRGSSSVLRGDVAERTSREAALLLNFGSRPPIREALLRLLGAQD